MSAVLVLKCIICMIILFMIAAMGALAFYLFLEILIDQLKVIAAVAVGSREAKGEVV